MILSGRFFYFLVLKLLKFCKSVSVVLCFNKNFQCAGLWFFSYVLCIVLTEYHRIIEKRIVEEKNKCKQREIFLNFIKNFYLKNRRNFRNKYPFQRISCKKNLKN